MKKLTAMFLALLLMSGLAGCRAEVKDTDLYRTDTVIYIPAEPTETETELESTVAETEETLPETTGETVPETTKATTAAKPSSTKKPSSSSSSSSNKNTSTAATTAPTEATTEATTEAATEATTEPEETAPPLYDISGYVVGSLETEMMDAINNYRTAEGLSELSKSSRLCAIASARAYEISYNWSHTRPDGSHFTTVFRDYGFGCSTAGEHLIYTSGGEDGASLVSRWMDIAANRNDLMSTGFTTVGIGIYRADGCIYIACLLAG